MIDMGKVKGQQVFYTGDKSLEDLMNEDLIAAIPDPHEGIIFKRVANCSPLELDAQMTVGEAKEFIEEWNRKLNC